MRWSTILGRGDVGVEVPHEQRAVGHIFPQTEAALKRTLDRLSNLDLRNGIERSRFALLASHDRDVINGLSRE